MALVSAPGPSWEGRAWCFGDDVDTDAMLPGKALRLPSARHHHARQLARTPAPVKAASADRSSARETDDPTQPHDRGRRDRRGERPRTRIAIEAAAPGATRLWLIDRDEDRLAALDDERPQSCDVRPRALDVTSRPAVAELGREWRDEVPPGLLVNVAGIRHAAAIGETTDDEWDDTLAVNLTGVFLVTRAVVVALRHHDLGGVVVNFASVAGDVGFTAVTSIRWWRSRRASVPSSA